MRKVNEIFKPKKITIRGKCKVIETSNRKYVLKPKNKDIKELYNYLNYRNFKNYPNIEDEFDNNYIYNYLEDNNIPISQKCEDMAKLLASLHNKTVHFKNIHIDEIKLLYEDILNNILYYEEYFNRLFNEWEKQKLLLPSENLLLQNRHKITSVSEFLKSELENWYNLVSNQTKQRVVYCHNNLSIEHYLNDNFISWDNYTIDSPILDLINLYKNDYAKYDFSNFLDSYMKNFSLLEDEKKLLFIMISIPEIKDFCLNEMQNTINATNMLNYIIETEKLIMPYYSV